MKTQISFVVALLMVAALTYSAVANADPDPIPVVKGSLVVKIEKGDQAKTIFVRLANLQDQRTEITIQNVGGEIVYKEWVWNETGYAKKLKLDGMKEGDYLLFVRNRNGWATQAFTLGEKDLAFFYTPETAAGDRPLAVKASYDLKGREGRLIARFTMEDANSVDVQLANLKAEPALVRLSVMGLGVMLDKKTTNENGFAQRFDLSGMPKGTYFFYIETAKATVIQYFDWDEQTITLKDTQRIDDSTTKFLKNMLTLN